LIIGALEGFVCGGLRSCHSLLLPNLPTLEADVINLLLYDGLVVLNPRVRSIHMSAYIGKALSWSGNEESILALVLQLVHDYP